MNLAKLTDRFKDGGLPVVGVAVATDPSAKAGHAPPEGSDVVWLRTPEDDADVRLDLERELTLQEQAQAEDVLAAHFSQPDPPSTREIVLAMLETGTWPVGSKAAAYKELLG